jgi:hypothetical protein
MFKSEQCEDSRFCLRQVLQCFNVKFFGFWISFDPPAGEAGIWALDLRFHKIITQTTIGFDKPR